VQEPEPEPDPRDSTDPDDGITGPPVNPANDALKLLEDQLGARPVDNG
jgi:hypothetical protein